MLGIRKWRGVAIDLYVGDPALFVADRSMAVADTMVLGEALQSMEAAGLRHLTLVPRGIAPQVLMRSIRDNLGDIDPIRSLGRVTIVLADRPEYDRYQAALFETFPDEA